MDATLIKATATRYFVKKRMMVNEEMGLCRRGRYRADLLALSMPGLVTVVEVKSSVADFRADKKWHHYLEYSNKFYFAMSSQTYARVKDKIPSGVGVMVVREREDRAGRMRRSVKVVRRATFRPLDPDVQKNLIIRMAFRNADHNRYKR